MDRNILNKSFIDRLPINGYECNGILKAIAPYYKEVEEFEHPSIYIGHYELTDLMGVTVKGPTKIGKAKYLSALNRGRSQGGCDWIFDYIFFVKKDQTHSGLEKVIHSRLREFKLEKPGHKELYKLTTEEAIVKVKEIIDHL